MAVQERYKKSSKNDYYRLYLKGGQKEKALIMNALCDILWLIVIDANRDLLSDAEMAEDVVESFLGGDLTAGDVGEMVEGEAEVFGEEVTGEVGVEAFEDTEEGSVGA